MAATGFPLFSWGHLLLLVLVPAFAAVLAWWGRRNGTIANRIRIALGVMLLVDSAAWYSWNLYHGLLRFPDRVPLQISHLVAFTAIAAALTANQWAFGNDLFHRPCNRVPYTCDPGSVRAAVVQ
ncbi:MAG TPA: hypothetical protein VKB88_34385 [Bryobacteraceae bacterium]|nr:hypothetical protein [Bryobacteraceae bacterium]